MVYLVNMVFGTKKWKVFVPYNWKFIMIEFVVTEFGCLLHRFSKGHQHSITKKKTFSNLKNIG
jgi:hypothetical protein